MTNREKFAEQILDIACGGSRMAVNKATLEPIACDELECKIVYSILTVMSIAGIKRKNGRIANMLNHQLTGQKLQLIHQYW